MRLDGRIGDLVSRTVENPGTPWEALGAKELQIKSSWEEQGKVQVEAASSCNCSVPQRGQLLGQVEETSDCHHTRDLLRLAVQWSYLIPSSPKACDIYAPPVPQARTVK